MEEDSAQVQYEICSLFIGVNENTLYTHKHTHT